MTLHRRQTHLMLDHTHVICKKVGREGGREGDGEGQASTGEDE